MSEFLLFIRLLPEIRKLVVTIGELIAAGRQEEAAEIVRSYQVGQASGRAAYEASKRAGKR